jgi:hypothetical protein
MLSCGAYVVMLSFGANVIIWCYHVMLSCGMITPPFFIFSENFTHSKNIVLLYIVCYTAQYTSNRSTAVLKDKCSLYFYDQYKHVLAKVRYSYLSDMTGIYLCMTYCGPETRGVATAITTDYHDSHTYKPYLASLVHIVLCTTYRNN